MISCSGQSLTFTTYSSSGDCTGSSASATSNYDDYNDGITRCYEVEIF